MARTMVTPVMPPGWNIICLIGDVLQFPEHVSGLFKFAKNQPSPDYYINYRNITLGLQLK